MSTGGRHVNRLLFLSHAIQQGTIRFSRTSWLRRRDCLTVGCVRLRVEKESNHDNHESALAQLSEIGTHTPYPAKTAPASSRKANLDRWYYVDLYRGDEINILSFLFPGRRRLRLCCLFPVTPYHDHTQEASNDRAAE